MYVLISLIKGCAFSTKVLKILHIYNHSIQTGSGDHQTPYTLVTGAVLSGVKSLEHETDKQKCL